MAKEVSLETVAARSNTLRKKCCAHCGRLGQLWQVGITPHSMNRYWYVCMPCIMAFVRAAMTQLK
jgi:hypothetical protein